MSLRSEIATLTTNSEISEAYALLKRRTEQIDISAAQQFRINQPVKFRSEKNGLMSGRISNIGRTGRVKVELINNRYDSYSMGAEFLKENLQ